MPRGIGTCAGRSMRPRVGENNEERLSFPASPEKTTRINGPWPPLEIQRGTIHVSLRSVRRDARPAGCRLSRPQPLEKQRGTILSPGHAARSCDLKRATDSNEVQFPARWRLSGAAGFPRVGYQRERGHVQLRSVRKAEEYCPEACIKRTEQVFSCQGRVCSPCSKRE
jgi:hypothetical protein